MTKYIDSELLTLTYMELLEEAQVKLLLYTSFCEPLMENGCVGGVLCHSKDGFCTFRAPVVVDGSGDGDVAERAGAEYVLGREADGKMQPATLMFKVGGVDTERGILVDDFEHLVVTEKGEIQALGREHLPPPAGHVLLHPSTLPGIVACNMTNIVGIDGTRAEDLTRAETEGRRQMEAIVAFLREYAPGYENCYVVGAASLIGVRETRHFKGLKTLTEKEIAEAYRHEDYVVWGAHYNFDMHSLTGAGLDETGSIRSFAQKKGYTIPYGCLVPEGVDGLLLAGRCISGTHMAHSNFRVMPICIGMGEAAGAAAALCAKSGKQPREIRAEEVRALIGGRDAD